MVSQRLQVISKPKQGTKTILKIDSKDTSIIFKGKGDLDLQCGKCGTVLVKGIKQGQLRRLVLYCNQCSSYNEIL